MQSHKSAQSPDKSRSGDNRGDDPLTSIAIAAASQPRAKPVRAKGVIRRRMSDQLRTALEAMAHEGLSLPLAAGRAKMAPESLKAAFRRPHVKQAYNQLVMEIRNNAGQSAFLRINHLSQTADSETVKLEANKWVAGVDNIAPIKRVEGRVQVSHSFAGFTFDDGEVVEGRATDDPSGGDTD